ncbi:HAMP domain-containing sensor histidine kinase [Actinacidiphila soli]|uniref:HAMP domain-containing sensor histidine kinase n=1 Tax=Actinacidiphila soli TaxID=2487275 RepID=UPI0013E341BD|nr:HAMP domain-containing sensor histidine kinase [Actinacidiphila soli]
MRAEAAEITGSDLHRRIPEPVGQDEIGRLARTLNSMLGRLESSAARQRRFVADASHELRTPLTSIRTSLEVGLAHPDRAPWPELAERAVTETSRLQHLVDALLLLARYDDSALLNRREHLDLAALAREVVAAVPSDVPVEVQLDAAVHMAGDPGQLNRLVRNLLDNAVRHARTKVSVTVTTDGPHTALIEVADDGPGIPTADHERVFDRFVRLQSARTRHHGDATGTGLGLSIARDITTAHGGSITLADTPGGPGARFVVRLPIVH